METGSDVHNDIETQMALPPIFEWFSTFPVLKRRIGWVSRLLMPKSTDKKGMGQLMGVAEKIVNQRYATTTEADPMSDMLGSCIKHGLPQE